MMNYHSLSLLVFLPVLVVVDSAPRHHDSDYYDHHFPDDHPVVHTVYTPNGPQVITQHHSPDGGYFYSSTGPGGSQQQMSAGSFGVPGGGYHYSSMSSGPGNHFGGQMSSMGGMPGMGSFQSMGQGMGSGMGMGMGMGQGMGMGTFNAIKPMKFEWWPSIFDNKHKRK